MSRRLIDLTGQKFGDLEVISRSAKIGSKGATYWNCECKCGETKDYRSDVLRKTGISNCGCHGLKIKIGDKVGKLTVVDRIPTRKRSFYWKCVCDCGNNEEVILSSYAIKHGVHKSCGCSKNPSGERHPNYKGYKEISGNHFNQIKTGAEIRSLSFKVSIEELWELFEKQKRQCSLSGLDIQFGIKSRIKEKQKECTASLDRIDSSKGYTIDNVQWVHKDINKMKNVHSQEAFINICRLVASKNK